LKQSGIGPLTDSRTSTRPRPGVCRTLR